MAACTLGDSTLRTPLHAYHKIFFVWALVVRTCLFADTLAGFKSNAYSNLICLLEIRPSQTLSRVNDYKFIKKINRYNKSIT